MANEDANARTTPPAAWVAAVRPGDTLILMFDRTLGEGEFDRLSDQLRPALDQVKIAIVDGGPTGCVVYRPGEESR